MTKGKNKQDAEDAPQVAGEQADAAEAKPAEPVMSPQQALQADRDDLFNRLQRTAADYQNYKRRVQKDMSEARDFAITELIREQLPIIDDMERAIDAAKENCGEDDQLLIGMQMVHDKALAAFEKFDLTMIDAAGKPFDPELHSALIQQPTSDLPPHTVMQVVQKGYTLHGRTIRPAAVIVSKDPEQDVLEDVADGETEGDSGEE